MTKPMCGGCGEAEALTGYGCGTLCAMCVMIGPPSKKLKTKPMKPRKLPAKPFQTGFLTKPA